MILMRILICGAGHDWRKKHENEEYKKIVN